MADNLTPQLTQAEEPGIPGMPSSLDEARSMARQRFKERLSNGEKIGECACGDESEQLSNEELATGPRVAGVRFLDSGRTYYFDPRAHVLEVGDWVVVETSRGKEAGRVILAPHQVKQSSLQGELKPVLRKLSADDVDRTERLKKEAGGAIRVFNAKIRERNLPMKPISAEYNFDGSHLVFNFTSPDRVDFRDLAKELSSVYRCRVELRQVGPRDEARLLGGVGRCGRTLCCSSWLPVYPEISMNMAKTQDLPLNPSKVSGVCGRLLCCLSYENEQYKQMKTTMPRLGQTIETPGGPGMVVSMQILKDLVTVRLAANNTDQVFAAADLGLRRQEPVMVETVSPKLPLAAEKPERVIEPTADEVEEPDADSTVADETQFGTARRRRRRGRGSRHRGQGAPQPQA
jgi:cell fate regulator YaaT (PSP1 superfamily)